MLRTSSSDFAPRPISATVSTATKQCIVTLDLPVTAGIRDRFNWTFNASLLGPNNVWIANPPLISSGNTVTFTGTPGGSATGPPIVQYTPPPFDIVGLNGQLMAGFTGFPLTVLP